MKHRERFPNPQFDPRQTDTLSTLRLIGATTITGILSYGFDRQISFYDGRLFDVALVPVAASGVRLFNNLVRRDFEKHPYAEAISAFIMGAATEFIQYFAYQKGADANDIGRYALGGLMYITASMINTQYQKNRRQ